jgi:hypothetical protein
MIDIVSSLTKPEGRGTHSILFTYPKIASADVDCREDGMVE